MDKDRVKGLAKERKGSLREAIGKVTGNGEAEAKGAAERAEGKAQSAADAKTSSAPDRNT